MLRILSDDASEPADLDSVWFFWPAAKVALKPSTPIISKPYGRGTFAALKADKRNLDAV